VGQAEIADLGLAVGRHEDVRGLHVAVDDSGLVRRGDAARRLLEELQQGAQLRAAPPRTSLSGRPFTSSIARYIRPSSSPAS